MCGGRSDYNAWLLQAPVDVVVATFSVVDRESFENVKSKWLLTCKEKVPDVPIVILGTKFDLRDEGKYKNNDPNNLVSFSEAEEFSKSLGCEYVEISTKQMEGLNDLVAAVVRTHCKNILKRNTSLKISKKQKLVIHIKSMIFLMKKKKKKKKK